VFCLDLLIINQLDAYSRFCKSKGNNLEIHVAMSKIQGNLVNKHREMQELYINTPVRFDTRMQQTVKKLY
jgi:hypothetical protein